MVRDDEGAKVSEVHILERGKLIAGQCVFYTEV